MKSCKIGDKVLITDYSNILNNDDIDPNFKDYTKKYKNKIVTIVDKLSPNDGENDLYYVSADGIRSPEGYYRSELTLMKPVEWDE